MSKPNIKEYQDILSVDDVNMRNCYVVLWQAFKDKQNFKYHDDIIKINNTPEKMYIHTRVSMWDDLWYNHVIHFSEYTNYPNMDDRRGHFIFEMTKIFKLLGEKCFDLELMRNKLCLSLI